MPPQYAAAFNPILLTLKTDQPDATTVNLYVSVDGGAIAPGGSATLEREVNRDGEATFDLEFIAKRVFYNAQNTLASGLIHDYNLIGYINVSTVSEEEAKENPQAIVAVINSVQQLNEWKDSGIDYVGVLYSGSIKRYDGFPLDIAAAALQSTAIPPTPTEAPTPTQTPTETPIPTETPTPTEVPTETPIPTDTPTQTPTIPPTETPMPTETPTPTEPQTSTLRSVLAAYLNIASATEQTATFKIRLFSKGHIVKTYDLTELVVIPDLQKDIDIIDILDTSGLYPTAGVRWHIESGCVPLSPYYVRWINKFGGWNYEMFEKNITETRVENYDNIQTAATNPNDTQRTVGMNVSERVTVNKGLLTRSQYDAVLGLARSPFIQWWNGESWQTAVITENVSATWNARNNFGDVSFTFLQPRILTQM